MKIIPPQYTKKQIKKEAKKLVKKYRSKGFFERPHRLYFHSAYNKLKEYMDLYDTMTKLIDYQKYGYEIKIYDDFKFAVFDEDHTIRTFEGGRWAIAIVKQDKNGEKYIDLTGLDELINGALKSMEENC